jgi:O-antigen ligase
VSAATHPAPPQAAPDSLEVHLPTGRGVGIERTRLATFLGKALFGTLLLVLLMSPFEVGYPPLGRILWTTYTNLEVSLFLMGAVWFLVLLVDGEARRRLLRLPLLLPMMALIAACVLSTLFGEYKSLGVQFIYRLLMGMLIFAAAWEALRGRRRLIVALGTFIGAGATAAGIGLLEFVSWVNLEPWLRVFKPQPTTVGGMLRLSGTFEYANGAAAYSEMVLPVLLGFIILFSSTQLVAGMMAEMRFSERLRTVVRVLLYIALALLTMALILTFSRAAWLGVVVAIAVLGLGLCMRRRSTPDGVHPMMARALGLAVAVMVLGTVYTAVTHPLLMLRLSSENDRDWYKNTIVPSPGVAPTLYASDFVTMLVTVRNEGPMLWRADRSPMVHLSYHWRQGDNADYVVFEGERTGLPHDVAPGESVVVDAVVLAPPKPGTYELEWDLVQEHVAWFYQKSKSRSVSTRYQVQPATGLSPVRPPQSSFPPVSVYEIEEYDNSAVPRGQLWRAAFAMFLDHPITGVGPDGFRHLYGRYAGKTEWNRNIYTNSTYLEMFTNLGLLGGFAFLWLVGLALWRAVRNLGSSRWQAARGEWIIALGATAALIAFLVHGFVDYFLFSTPLYIAFWFIMAVSVHQTTDDRWRTTGDDLNAKTQR